MMTNEEMAKRAHVLLAAIDYGWLTVKPVGESWHECWAGNVTFEVSNGWRVVIFNDADEWDYIDSIIAPSGESLDFDYMYDNDQELTNWSPEHPEYWGIKP